MATTTNYSWVTPDDTSLVKDGASAIRTLGSSVDTTVFANANAAINKAIVDAKGDLIAATAADTVARLAVGANNTVLIADSAEATGMKWALPSSGGMTLISTTTLSGATVTLSSIPSGYNSLLLVISGVTNATANGTFRCAPNGTTTITSQIYPAGNGTQVTQQRNVYMQISSGFTMTNSNTNNAFCLQIFNYASASAHKSFSITGGYSTTTDLYGTFTNGIISTNSEITSLVFSNSGGNLSTGTVLLYGVK